MSAPRKQRIFVVSGQPVCRHGMTQIINSEVDLVVCGEAASAVHSPNAARHAKADLVLLDLPHADPSGPELVNQFRRAPAELPVLIISSGDESAHVLTLLRAGARGYVTKTDGLSEFLAAIRKVLEGQIYLNRASGEQLISSLAAEEPSPADPLERLTRREREVLHLIAAGRGNQQIAEDLKLSSKTIETHRQHIKEKLGLKSAAELMRFAVTMAPK